MERSQNMGKFDVKEQNIYEVLSQITVDSSKLAGQVKGRLHEDIPNISANKRWGSWAKTGAVAIVMSMVLVVTVTAAILGNFDWFIEKFNPSFGRVIEPVEAHSEDQGIRMEVIGAQKYDNKAIVYLSLQDVTGQNRLTGQTEFRDGFGVKMNRQTQEMAGQVSEIVESSVSWSQKMLYFNEDTNTVYYEFNITADPDSPLAAPLELSSFLIYFNEKAYKDEPISVSLSDIGVAEITPIQEEQIWGGNNVPDNLSPFTEALVPGYYVDMPHGEKDQWVSNIGVIDGKLHVQIGTVFGKEFGSNDASLSLKDLDGNLIPSDYVLVFLGDVNNHLLDLKQTDYANAMYKYQEAIFSVNIEDLSKYTICYTGSFSTGVEGNWNVTANLSDSNKNIRIWTNDISVEGHLFEHLTLSPLGLQVIGTYKGEECMVSNMILEVETIDGIIPLKGGGGSQNPEKHTFNSSWNTTTPLDVSTVTAVFINGTRIPTK